MSAAAATGGEAGPGPALPNHQPPSLAHPTPPHPTLPRTHSYKEATGGQAERMVSGSDDFTMFLWKPSESKQPVARMTGHVQTVNQVRWGGCVSGGRYELCVGHGGGWVSLFRRGGGRACGEEGGEAEGLGVGGWGRGRQAAGAVRGPVGVVCVLGACAWRCASFAGPCTRAALQTLAGHNIGRLGATRLNVLPFAHAPLAGVLLA